MHPVKSAESLYHIIIVLIWIWLPSAFDTVCVVPVVGYIYLVWNNVWGTFSGHIQLRRIFSKKKKDCTSYLRPPLYEIYILYLRQSAGVQLILLVLFGAVDEPRCLLYDGPLLGLGVKLWVGVKVAYDAEGYFCRFLPLFVFCTLLKFCLLFLFENTFTLK